MRGITFETFARDRRSLLALERLMELLGEAARRVSEELRNAHPEIPWRTLVGLRNILAHEYGTIDHRRLFLAASNDILRFPDVLKRCSEKTDSETAMAILIRYCAA